MKHTKLVAAGLFAASALGFAGSGYAATCGSGLDTTNMTINMEAADNCHGAFDPGQGNSSTTLENYLNNNNIFGGGWDHVVRDETPQGGTSTGDIVSGIQFSLSATGGSTGSFTLTLNDTNGPTPLNIPVTFDLVGVLKGGSGEDSAAYFFDDITLNGSNSGTYEIVFDNNGGNNPALSHLDILVRNGRTPPPTNVPEPAPVAMLGLGLAGLALMRRRGRKEG